MDPNEQKPDSEPPSRVSHSSGRQNQEFLVGAEVPVARTEEALSDNTVSDQTRNAHRVTVGGMGLFAVRPKRSCPHLNLVKPAPPSNDSMSVHQACEKCEAPDGNWICLTCYMVLCGRDRNKHMLAHYSSNNSHPLCLSFDDLSVWCYGCASYVDYELPELNEIHRRAYKSKFKENRPGPSPSNAPVNSGLIE